MDLERVIGDRAAHPACGHYRQLGFQNDLFFERSIDFRAVCMDLPGNKAALPNDYVVCLDFPYQSPVDGGGPTDG